MTETPDWISVHLHRFETGNRVVIEDAVNGTRECDLQASLKIRNASPTGFEWGYGGSGPCQTAVAILLAYGLDRQEILYHHQRFKFEFVSKWPRAGDTFESDHVIANIPIGVWLKAERSTAKYKAFEALTEKGQIVFD